MENIENKISELKKARTSLISWQQELYKNIEPAIGEVRQRNLHSQIYIGDGEYPPLSIQILLDTSGDMDKTLLKNFVMECFNTLNDPNACISVGCFDTKFYGFTQINNSTDIDEINFIGGNKEVDYNVAMDVPIYDNSRKIIFTQNKMNNLPIDSMRYFGTYWIIANDNVDLKSESIIYINSEQLEQLNKENKFNK